MNRLDIVDINPENVFDYGIYCIKNKTSAGYQAKVNWCGLKCNDGLRIKIVVDSKQKQIGFIEYLPSEQAWRPVRAKNYFFIHCIAIFSKGARKKNVGSSLLQACENDAREHNKSGVCVMTSEGAWMANKSLFERNGYIKVDERGRFELLCKKFDEKNPTPVLINWETEQKKYKGWNLVYADQCPWHEKSVTDLKQKATELGIKLKVKKLLTPEEARKAPSGFGVFSLVRDGRLLEDHYLSKTRFGNIVREELENGAVL